MPEILVDSQTVRVKANELGASNERCRTQVGRLAETEAELGSMWEGDGKNSFHAAFLRDRAEMDKFCDTVTQYVTELNKTMDRYDAVEARNVELAATRTYHG